MEKRLAEFETKLSKETLPPGVDEFCKMVDDETAADFKKKYSILDEITMFDMVAEMLQIADDKGIDQDKLPIPGYFKPGYK